MLPLLNQGISRQLESAKAEAILERVGLTALSQKPARQLSLGQRKRAAIAAALVTVPDLIILD
jgi:ABC-2 type transport system ATP-binding protein